MESRYKASLDELKDFFVWESVPWLNSAACRSKDVRKSWWFNRGTTKVAVNIRTKARDICIHDCPVRWQCLARYIEEPSGIFGGFDEKERKAFRNRTHFTKWHNILVLQQRFKERAA